MNKKTVTCLELTDLISQINRPILKQGKILLAYRRMRNPMHVTHRRNIFENFGEYSLKTLSIAV